MFIDNNSNKNQQKQQNKTNHSLVARLCNLHVDKVRFQVLTATSMKLAVFWDLSPCSLLDIDRRFRGRKHLSSVD
jgi:hypothetical protein